MLSMLRVDLGIMGTTAYDERFTQLLRTAEAAIKKEGATLNFEQEEDRQLCVMFAAWLWRRRDSQGAMPRMVRYLLNNRILGEKAKAETGE